MTKPDKCISVAEARALQDNWVNTREPVITSMRGGTQDTREFVFSVSDLEEFLDYVKAESSKQGINNPGVRIYFAAYNNSKSDKSTLFLAPTKGTNPDADNNYDLEPFNTITGGYPPNGY